MKKLDIVLKNLYKTINFDLVESGLSKLTEDELEALIYSCYRTAEKLGADNFETVEVVDN